MQQNNLRVASFPEVDTRDPASDTSHQGAVHVRYHVLAVESQTDALWRE
jgi:hypothetical protein